MVRKMQVMKMRGQAPIPGLHTFRITDDGVQVFPRSSSGRMSAVPPAVGRRERHDRGSRSASSPRRHARRRHSGRALRAARGSVGIRQEHPCDEFIMEGARRDEPGVIAVFEKRPTEFAQDGRRRRWLVRDRKVEIIHTRPLDLSIDETLHEIASAIHGCGRGGVVIDSLSGFELALAPTFREDFRESLYRMVTVLTGDGHHHDDDGGAGGQLHGPPLQPARYGVSDRRHHHAALRRDEGQLQRVMAVVKMRGSGHSKDLRAFDVTAEGGSPVPIAGARPRAAPKKAKVPSRRRRTP
jgi:circadian clock protein KaiC